MGWEVGTLIIGSETYECIDVVEITAVGVHAVLGRTVIRNGQELDHTYGGSWVFTRRDWTPAPIPT